MAERFISFVESFSHHFVSYRHDVSEKARQYASGLMQAGRKKNMDRMAEVVPETRSRNLQQFLTHSKWDARAVMDQVAVESNALIGDSKNACLLIDESGFAKQGKKSVGTARQWLGRLGKVDNGQVAVYGALSNGRYVMPVDTRLYLPKVWTDDTKRCEEAGVPKGERIFRTKNELSLEIVRHARENELEFAWVGADAGYGKGPGFLQDLEDCQEIFLIDVHSDFNVYREDPAPSALPRKKKGKEAGAARYETKEPAVEVSKLVDAVLAKSWKTVTVRETTRGLMKLNAFRQRVWVWDGESSKARCYELLATETLEGKDRKISLTNATSRTSLARLAYIQHQRYWIKRSFEYAKGECGMADYQVRKWNAWHHHMALVMMAMLFMLNERMAQQEQYPLLSCADVEVLLSKFLPRRDITAEEVLRQMEHRHKQCASAAASHRHRAAQNMAKTGR